MEKIDEFTLKMAIEGKQVYMLDTAAAVFNIPIERYHKNYDMFNLGNFGGQGQDGIIEDIKTKENAVYLIKKSEYAKNWQHPYGVTNYVIENYKKIGEIDIYDIYEK